MYNRIVFFILFLSSFAFGQQKLSGVVSDENGEVIPFATIYIKNSEDDRTKADANGYYEMRLFTGEYFLVIQATGYDTRETYVTISEKDEIKDIQLFTSRSMDLDQIEYVQKKSNPGREIMLKVVAKKDSISFWQYPHIVHGYIRATEKVELKEKKKDKKEDNEDPTGQDDPFDEAEEIANGMNIEEIDLTRHYGGNNKVKEIRNAYELRGKKRNLLYYTTTVKSNFDFFKNYLQLDDLHETPVSSPISGPGILSYKYRLVDQYEEGGYKIHKIKITSRNSSTSTLEGHIYVIDSLWLVQKLELSFEKGNLLLYDHFDIIQEFDHPGDSICILTRQEFNYGVEWKDQTSTCKTVATFDSYDFKPNWERKFFGSEVAVTEQEAYEKDTTYWNQSRTTQLTEEEKRFIIVQDSIHDAHNRKEYLDSVDAIFNKVTALKILWWGVDHRNRAKMTQWTINSLAAMIRPIYIAGPRVEGGFYFFKKWESQRTFDMGANLSYGFMNRDIKGDIDFDFRYDPFHFGTVSMSFAHSFDVIRSYDAITQIYKRSNFIEKTELGVGHLYEVLNGLYLTTDFSFAERRSIDNYEFIDEIDETLPNDEPDSFEPYQAFIADIRLKFVPFQKYMREPNRKVILGSKWPSFTLAYEKGIPGIFGSDVDHDYLYGTINQTFKILTLGTSSYRIKAGAFLNTKNLYDADEKFHRRSDPIWLNNPLNAFQGLNQTLPTRRIFLEAHFVHHDNAAILTKLPFMKKANIGIVVAAGFLYVPEHEWLHYEFLGGLERSFKFSRRKLRVGVYGVQTYSNQQSPISYLKVSFALLDTRNMKWNF